MGWRAWSSSAAASPSSNQGPSPPPLPGAGTVASGASASTTSPRATARDATISDAIALVNRFQMTGVDLDYEHLPVKTNATAAGGGLQKSLFQQSSDVYNDRANLVKPFSLFLRQISAALHAKGHKLSQCVGLYPTRDGGASMFYDPAVVGETVDTVRVMNYDMCKPRPPTRQQSR